MTNWHDSAAEQLRSVLLQHADADRAEKAIQHLLKAIESYHRGKPIIGLDGRREGFALASAREKVGRLRTLSATGDWDAVLAGIRDPEILLHVAREHGGPIGSVTAKTVGQLLRKVEDTLRDQARRGRPDDYHRDVLAHDIALVVRDVLGVSATASEGRSANPFHEVLRATFEAAGIVVSDIRPWAETGRAMLEDDSIPHNLLK